MHSVEFVAVSRHLQAPGPVLSISATYQAPIGVSEHTYSLCPYCGSWMSFVKDIICIRGGNIIMMQIKLTSPFKFQFSPSLNSRKLSCEDQPHIIQGRALDLGWQAPISRMMKEGESLMPICSVSGSGSRSADWVLSSLWSHHIRSMPASLHDS